LTGKEKSQLKYHTETKGAIDDKNGKMNGKNASSFSLEVDHSTVLPVGLSVSQSMTVLVNLNKNKSRGYLKQEKVGACMILQG
jgi:hypothetical protein